MCFGDYLVQAISLLCTLSLDEIDNNNTELELSSVCSGGKISVNLKCGDVNKYLINIPGPSKRKFEDLKIF